MDTSRCTRPWGFYEVLKDADVFKTKRIVVSPHQRLSLQSHNQRAEHWVCLSGSGHAQVDDDMVPLSPNRYVFIPQGAKHRLVNSSDEDLVIIEIQTGAYFGEDDIVRYSDDYGRSGN
jgi:mannose-6-phosphate isomerase-like protein (cupin superfamily)